MPAHATQEQVTPTRDLLEQFVIAVAAVVGLGANAALGLALVTFLYVLVTLL